MAANKAVIDSSKTIKLACGLAAALAAILAPGSAAADDSPPRMVGGHVGIATPLVTVSSKTTSISDQFTLLTPIGISVHLSPKVVFDFETIVANPVHPAGQTGFVVDPGIVYNWGGVATGLRVAFKTNNNANVGLVPLVNVGLADLGGSTWFVEAAFPTFIQDQQDDTGTGRHLKGEFNVVFHTGIGF